MKRRPALLREQIVRMDCERCKLKTEHYLVDNGEKELLCRCMRCGYITMSTVFFTEGHEPYPIDSRRPLYVA